MCPGLVKFSIMNKSVYIFIFSILSLLSCGREGLIDDGKVQSPADTPISYAVQIAPYIEVDVKSGSDKELCGANYTRREIYGEDTLNVGISLLSVTPIEGEPLTKGSRVTSITSFGLFGYRTVGGSFSSTSTSSFINNMNIVNSSSIWAGSTQPTDIRYWPPDFSNKVSFFAYYPRLSSTSPDAQGLSLPTTAAQTGAPRINYAVPEAVANQPDILVARRNMNLNNSNSSPAPPVTFTFDHALACINFKVYGNPADGIEYIGIKGIKASGTLSLDNNGGNILWTPAATNSKTLFKAGLIASPTASTSGTSVVAESGYLMMIPQTLTNEAMVVIKFTNRRYPIENPIKLTTIQDWGAGKVYTYGIYADNVPTNYVDEYGVDRGPGLLIPMGTEGWRVIAPVNCGYRPAGEENIGDKGYIYGKMFQWGRKYGQGRINGVDATAPTVLQAPTIPFATSAAGQNVLYANRFFQPTAGSPYNWNNDENIMLWNKGSENAPIKGDYDPCPSGWRTMTFTELGALTVGKIGNSGTYIHGTSTINAITFIIPGFHYELVMPGCSYINGSGALFQNPSDKTPSYWSSSTTGATTFGFKAIFIYGTNCTLWTTYNSCGLLVRCIKE